MTSSRVFWRAAPKKARSLLDIHRASLVDDSHIHPGIVEARGYYSLKSVAVEFLISERVFDSRLRSATSWMGIPIIRPDGEYHGDIIRLFGSDLPVKYLWPSGFRQAADIHPMGREEFLDDITIPIVFTEGIKKADAIFSASIEEDIPCLVVALNGCWGWRSRLEGGDGSIVLPDFQNIPMTNRKSYVISDSDFRSNDDVRSGWTEMTRYLNSKFGKGNLAKLVIVPSKGLEKQGADDWLSQGHTLEELLSYAATPNYVTLSTEDVTPRPLIFKTALDVIASARDKVPHVIEPIIPEKGILLLAGHSGTFKTWHAMSLVMDAAFGLGWTNHPEVRIPSEPVTSIYVNKEMGAQMMGTRFRLLARSDRYKGHPEYDRAVNGRIVVVGEGEAQLDVAQPSERARLEELILMLGARIVVLDSLSMSWSGDENSSTEVGELYRQLRGISDRTGVSWIIVHHLLKPEQGRKRYLPDKHTVRGSGQLVQQADSIILCSNYDAAEPIPNVKKTIIAHTKGRAMGELPAWITKLTDHDGINVTIEFVSKLADEKAGAYSKSHGDPAKLMEWLKLTCESITMMQPGEAGMRTKELITMLQVAWPTKLGAKPSDSTIRRGLDRLVDTGGLEVLDRNQRNGDLFILPEIVPELGVEDNIEEVEE